MDIYWWVITLVAIGFCLYMLANHDDDDDSYHSQRGK